jgi:putative SOS response-associated peptidase YedK
MCGRFTLKSKPEAIAAEFGLPAMPLLEPRYNVAPTQAVAAVRLDGDTGTRRLDLLRWGLVPPWADDPAIGNRLINARAESVAEKPAFRQAFLARRCIIISDGFYEWAKRADGRKQPFFIRRRDGRPFGFAGLWEQWQREEAAPIYSCTVITTEANDLVRPIHGRMPAILRPEDYRFWLDPAIRDKVTLGEVLAPYPDGDLVAYPVSTLVNAAANDREECVRAIAG